MNKVPILLKMQGDKRKKISECQKSMVEKKEPCLIFERKWEIFELNGKVHVQSQAELKILKPARLGLIYVLTENIFFHE